MCVRERDGGGGRGWLHATASTDDMLCVSSCWPCACSQRALLHGNVSPPFSLSHLLFRTPSAELDYRKSTLAKGSRWDYKPPPF